MLCSVCRWVQIYSSRFTWCSTLAALLGNRRGGWYQHNMKNKQSDVGTDSAGLWSLVSGLHWAYIRRSFRRYHHHCRRWQSQGLNSKHQLCVYSASALINPVDRSRLTGNKIQFLASFGFCPLALMWYQRADCCTFSSWLGCTITWVTSTAVLKTVIHLHMSSGQISSTNHMLHSKFPTADLSVFIMLNWTETSVCQELK